MYINTAGWKAFEQSLQEQIAKSRYLWWVRSFSMFLFLPSFWQSSFAIPWGEEEKEMGRGRKRRGRVFYLSLLPCATFSFPCLPVSIFIISLPLWKRGIWCKLMLGLRDSVILQGADYLRGRRSVRLLSYSIRGLRFEWQWGRQRHPRRP